MGVRYSIAKAASSMSTGILKNVFHRQAGNFPGKIAMSLDPDLLSDLAGRLSEGSILVVGTNGKTTTTNMIADVLEASGKQVVCNRAGANLASGIATSLLRSDPGQWGVFECDELWLAKVLPFLKSKYVFLLNLFPDQLDRIGGINTIQESIAKGLAASPDTVLVYCADDPNCARIARMCENRTIPFGIDEDLHLPKEPNEGAQMCQCCSSLLSYRFRQYAQLGAFSCPTCDFSRDELAYRATDVDLGVDHASFTFTGDGFAWKVNIPFSGAYMVYNLAAVGVAVHLLDCSFDAYQTCISEYDPKNGRLQKLTVAGRSVLLNLAKNPTGFNQNVRIILNDHRPLIAAFFVNDQEGDGRDTSWIWDVDFEALAQRDDIRVFVGGSRKNDLQLRLKYAGIASACVDNAQDVFDATQTLPASVGFYFVANYTALPPIREEVQRLAENSVEPDDVLHPEQDISFAQLGKGKSSVVVDDMAKGASYDAPVIIVHLLPDVLDQNGDNGNVVVLQKRLSWRGIPVEVKEVPYGSEEEISDADLIFLGNGDERQLTLAQSQLERLRSFLEAYIQDGGPLFAVCGGLSLLGETWNLGDGSKQGLSLLPIVTECAEGAPERFVGDVALRNPLAAMPILGYVNRVGRVIAQGIQEPFGTVAASGSIAKLESSDKEGIRFRNVFGTSLHGPVLAKSPELADALLTLALAHRQERCNVAMTKLQSLDDSVETAANKYLSKRLNVQ